MQMEFWRFAKRCDTGVRLTGVVVHVASDHYGDRLAVCTADDTVSVWHAVDSSSSSSSAHHSASSRTGNSSSSSTKTTTATSTTSSSAAGPSWHCTARWTTPYAARAAWAHPAFGAVLATVGRGRTEHDALVWADAPAPPTSRPAPAPAPLASSAPPLRAPLARRGSVLSASRTPNSSAGVAAGIAAVVPNSGYSTTSSDTNSLGPDAAAWECLAALGNGNSESGINNTNTTPAVAFGQQMLPGAVEAVPVLAVGSARAVAVYAGAGDGALRRWTVLCTVTAPVLLGSVPGALAWCAVPRDQPRLCAGTTSGAVVVVDTRARTAGCAVASCAIASAHTAPVVDVAWRPALGRSFDLLATAALDHRIRIWRLTFGARGVPQQGAEKGEGVWRCVEGGDCAVECVATFELGSATPRALAWNRTGTLLAAACDDDAVRMWQCIGLGDVWRPVPLF